MTRGKDTIILAGSALLIAGGLAIGEASIALLSKKGEQKLIAPPVAAGEIPPVRIPTATAIRPGDVDPRILVPSPGPAWDGISFPCEPRVTNPNSNGGSSNLIIDRMDEACQKLAMFTALSPDAVRTGNNSNDLRTNWERFRNRLK